MQKYKITNLTDFIEHNTAKDLNGENGVEVQHLKVTGGGHEWPGYKGNMDVNASQEVWNFLKAFDLNGKIDY